jgi:hypothetical protein
VKINDFQNAQGKGEAAAMTARLRIDVDEKSDYTDHPRGNPFSLAGSPKGGCATWTKRHGSGEKDGRVSKYSKLQLNHGIITRWIETPLHSSEVMKYAAAVNPPDTAHGPYCRAYKKREDAIGINAGACL